MPISKITKENKLRMIDIFKCLIVDGETSKKVAERFDISGARVNQIAFKQARLLTSYMLDYTPINTKERKVIEGALNSLVNLRAEKANWAIVVDKYLKENIL